MRTTLHFAIIAGLGALMLASGVPAAAPGSTPDKQPYEGKTGPSKTVTLSAQVPGIVKEIFVKPGDEVKTGDPLLQQDDREAVNQLQILEQEANSNIRVDAAEADLAQKNVELKRIQKLFNDEIRGATDLELERAQLDVTFKAAQKALSVLELAKSKLEAEGARLKVEFMKRLAPFDGVVESIDTEVGAMLDPQRPGMMTIVANDPVKIVVHLPAPQAAKLKKGDPVEVRYKIDAADAWQQAKVKYLAPVADAGAGYDSRREVHLEMPNPSKRETGLWMWVKLPEAPAAAAVR